MGVLRVPDGRVFLAGNYLVGGTVGLLQDVVCVLVLVRSTTAGGSGALEDPPVAHHIPASCCPCPKEPCRLGVEGTILPPPWVGTGDSWGIFIEGETVRRAPCDSIAVLGGWGSAWTPALTPATNALLSPRGGPSLPTAPVGYGRTSGTPFRWPPVP